MAGEWEDVPVDRSGWEDVPQQAQVNEQPSVLTDAQKAEQFYTGRNPTAPLSQEQIDATNAMGANGIDYLPLLNPAEWFRSQTVDLGNGIGTMNLPSGKLMNALSPFGWTAPAQAAAGIAAGLDFTNGGSFLERVAAGENAAKTAIENYRNSPNYSPFESLPTDIAFGYGITKGVEGVASGLPFLERYVGANILPAATKWGRAAQRAVQGGLGGTVFGTLDAAGHDRNPLIGAGVGLLAGGILSPLLGAAGEFAMHMKDRINGLSPSMKKLAEIANESGHTAEGMKANLQKAQTISGDKAILADTGDIYQNHLGQALAVSPLKQQNEAISAAMKQRAEETSNNVLKAMDRITGTSADKSAALTANMGALRAEAKPIFDKFGVEPVVIDKEGMRLISKLEQDGYSELRSILQNKDIVPQNYLPEKLSDFIRYRKPVPFAFLDEARQLANSLYKAKFISSGSGKGLDVVSKQIGSYAKEVGDKFGNGLTGIKYSDFLKKYGTESSNQEALKIGQDIFKLTPREINKFIASHSDLDKQYLQQGVRDAIKEKMDSVATGTASEINTIMSRQKMRDLFSFIADSPEQSRAIADLFHQGAKNLVTSAKVDAGITAGKAARAAATFEGPATGPATELGKANYLNAYRQVVANIAKSGHNERTVQMADEMAKFLSSSGKEAQANIDELFKIAGTLKGRNKVGAYKFLQVLSGKLASQSQQKFIPDNNNGK